MRVARRRGQRLSATMRAQIGCSGPGHGLAPLGVARRWSRAHLSARPAAAPSMQQPQLSHSLASRPSTSQPGAWRVRAHGASTDYGSSRAAEEASRSGAPPPRRSIAGYCKASPGSRAGAAHTRARGCAACLNLAFLVTSTWASPTPPRRPQTIEHTPGMRLDIRPLDVGRAAPPEPGNSQALPSQAHRLLRVPGRRGCCCPRPRTC